MGRAPGCQSLLSPAREAKLPASGHTEAWSPELAPDGRSEAVGLGEKHGHWKPGPPSSALHWMNSPRGCQRDQPLANSADRAAEGHSLDESSTALR